jgi:hypothetical protein
VYNYTPKGTWQEDRGWVAQLDKGWAVEPVREAAYAALAQVGGCVVLLAAAGVTPTHASAFVTLHCNVLLAAATRMP